MRVDLTVLGLNAERCAIPFFMQQNAERWSNGSKLFDDYCGDGPDLVLVVVLGQRLSLNLNVVLGLVQLVPCCITSKASHATEELWRTALPSASLQEIT